MSQTVEDQSDDPKGFFEEDHLREYLGRVADTLNLSGPKYLVELGTKTGDNHMGVVYTVSIEGERNGAPVKIDTIFKVPAKDETKRLISSVATVFPREHVFYTEIVPVFEEFLGARNKTLDNIPRCYFSSAEDHKETICLEDLRPKGFVMRDRMKQLDFPHASMAFRALGRLHALSFALRDQRPDVFRKKIAALKEATITPDYIANESTIARFEVLGELVQTALAQDDPKYGQQFSDFSKDLLSHLERSCDGNVAEPYAVLCHGDFWTNNMLFKYDEDPEEPRDIYLLDFQLSRFASPATDISYNLFSSCGQELRAKHFDELVKIYHDSLSDYLLELGSDTEKLFPFEALLDQLKRFSVYGAGAAVFALPTFTSHGNDIDTGTDYVGEVVPRLQERIHRDHFWRNAYRDTIKDLIDRNYI